MPHANLWAIGCLVCVGSLACNGAEPISPPSQSTSYEDVDTTPCCAFDPAPRLNASPPHITFPRVPADAQGTTRLELQNVGDSPLTISKIELEENSGEFSFCLPNATDTACIEGFNAEVLLAPLASLIVEIGYTPESDGEDLNTLLIYSNDPHYEANTPHRIEIRANGQAPCLHVSDSDGIDFQTGFIGETSTRTVTLTNCSSSKDLEVYAIAMDPESDPEFAIDNLPEGLPAEPIILAPDKTTNFVVSYAPTAETMNTGNIAIRSNDPAQAQLLLPVFGHGSNNTCPTPIALARQVGEGGPWVEELEVGTLATIAFDGSQSIDPDSPEDRNAISRYAWTIIERPTDSRSQFMPNSTVAKPSLFLDLAGRYTIELQVYDAQHTPSCEVSRITLTSTPQEDIHIQLVWDTPGDSNQTDSGLGQGADLNLHFLHPSGDWNSSTWDCHWRNTEPEWASPGNADNPSLDIDDSDGAGPENINLNTPEELDYRVGVHYFSDHGFGPSYATLRIFIRQEMVFEYRDKRLDQTGQFWDIATIAWPSGDVRQHDQIHEGFP